MQQRRQQITSGVLVDVFGPTRVGQPSPRPRQTVVSHGSMDSDVTAVVTAFQPEAIFILYLVQDIQGVYEQNAHNAGWGG